MLRGVSYRPPARAPKGAWAHRIHDYRRRMDLSVQAAFEAWHEGLGFARTSRAAYDKIDKGGRPPNDREAQYLASIMGWPTEEDELANEPPDQSALVVALTRQSEAIEALVDEIRASRLSRDARDEELMRLVAALTQPTPQGGGGHGARVRTP